MKKITIAILLFSLISCSLFKRKIMSGREGQIIPDFHLLKDSTTSFNTSKIAAGKPFVILLFQPNCPYCQTETQDILRDIKHFQNIPIYFISTYSFADIEKFVNRYQLKKYPNIMIARDSANQVLSYFNGPGVPYLAYYDKQRKLKQVVIGKEDINTIKSIVTN